ncbi:hypothetical protein H6G89_24840 [Oscillatoria sp. FACHB-1407]|uniref:hypothetical protein n=1 Tax=Oscillatoria sp. FACHB-1407 TaxID=2692847 RepID=UPI001688496D|nr:hypothetical protein [Oscillatoria sp. FACHB-1407]MBD2464235.1 hypothetical protein [Oscillatoria sp. FACHB-1407]
MTIRTIDAILPPAEVDEVLAALDAIRQKLSFLTGLTPTERRQIAKLGLKSQTFVVKALDVATQYSNLMPRCLNIEEARRDLALFEALNPVLQSLSQLRELVEDTQMVAGSEAYAAARVAYSSIKTVGKSVGLDEVKDDLAQRFRKTRKAQPQVEPQS